MESPGGWTEPGQTPEFDEYTLVLRGMLKVEYKDGFTEIRVGQAGRKNCWQIKKSVY